MALCWYVAKRSLISGVSLNDQVYLDLPVRYAGLNKSRMSHKTVRTSLAGIPEVYYYRGAVSWSISCIPVDEDKRDEIVMFLDSVEEGQVFQFAPYDFSSTPSPDFRSVMLDQSEYTAQLESMLDSMTVFSMQFLEVVDP